MNFFTSLSNLIVIFGSALPLLGVLIAVHEFGHFLLAKLCGVRVQEFAIGFGKPLLRRKYGDTNYSLRLIPLGGYVKMAGDDRRLIELSSEKNDDLSDEEREEFESWGPKEGWFLEKRFVPKSLIVLAGPVFNLVFAVLLSAASLYWYGQVSGVIDEPLVGDVVAGFPAEQAGILPGDRITAIDGVPTTSWRDMAERISGFEGSSFSVSVQRVLANGEKEEREFTISGKQEDPEVAAVTGQAPDRKFRIGILAKAERKSVGMVGAVWGGVVNTWEVSRLTVRGLGAMISGMISPKNIRGPIFIFQQAGAVAKQGLESLLGYAFFLNISLAVFNLLPIPILDGGHLVIFSVEAVKRSPFSTKGLQMAQQVGLVILLSLMFLAMSNDIVSLIT